MTIRVLCSLLLTAALGGLWSAPTPAHAQSAQQMLNESNARIGKLSGELELANRQLARAKDQYRAGAVRINDVENAQAARDRLTFEVQRAQHDRAEAAMRMEFSRPVTIQLDHASVSQFAAALSKATGISVKVDPGVPADASTMLTLDVQGVPFANVLEAIATKTDLMIARADTGVVLKRWPHLNDRVFRTPTAPWSSDWGVPPTLMRPGAVPGGVNPYGSMGGGLPLLGSGGDFAGGNNTFFSPSQQRELGGGLPALEPGSGNPGQQRFGPGNEGPQPGQPGFQPGQPGFQPGGQGPQPGQPGFQPGGVPLQAQPGMGGFMPGMGGGLPFTMTAIGDHMIAIAEPGTNERGEPGVWMTAYVFQGSAFSRVGRGFHPFMNGPQRPQNRAPGGPDVRPQGFRPPGGSIPPQSQGAGPPTQSVPGAVPTAKPQ